MFSTLPVLHSECSTKCLSAAFLESKFVGERTAFGTILWPVHQTCLCRRQIRQGKRKIDLSLSRSASHVQYRKRFGSGLTAHLNPWRFRLHIFITTVMRVCRGLLSGSNHIRKQMPMFQSGSDQCWVLAGRISTVSMKGALCQWRAAVAASVVFSELHHATSCSLPCITLIWAILSTSGAAWRLYVWWGYAIVQLPKGFALPPASLSDVLKCKVLELASQGNRINLPNLVRVNHFPKV